MTKIFIHQPDFAPWLNFFYRISISDIFVVLDDVQFRRRGFINKDFIKTASGKEAITIPVVKKERDNYLINQVEISYEHNWIEKFIKKIEFNYKDSKNFKNNIFFFKSLLEKKEKYLMNFNLKIIYYVFKNLNINTKIIFSSNLKLKQKKSDRILEICNNLNASEYITGQGSKEYLDYKRFSENNIRINDNLFLRKKYNQLHGEFLPDLSIIDFLFNVSDSKKFLFQ